MINRLLIALLLLVSLGMTETAVKNPWTLEFKGNDLFTAYQLEQQLELPEEFGLIDTSRQDFLMKLAKGNIELLYYSKGYFSSKILLDIQKKHVTTDSVYTIYHFTIEEGDRYTFNEFSVEKENPQDTNLIVADNLHITQGQNYDPVIVSDDIQEIRTLYRNHGYLHVRVDYIERLDTTRHLVNVEIFVASGTQVKMGDFTSSVQRPPQFKDSLGRTQSGLSDTVWLNSLWRVKKGDVIDGKKYTSFRSKLFSTQLFTQVKLEDSLRTDGLSDIHFQAIERIPGEAHYSTFYEELYGFGASASSKHKNFFGHFNEGSLSILVAQNKQELSLGYANPLLFGTGLTVIPTAIRFDDRIIFNHEKISPPAYPDSLEERLEVINRGDLTFGFSKNIRFRGTIDSRFVQKNEDRLLKLKLETALTFDYTDDYFNPTQGIRLAPTAGVGANFDGTIRNPELSGHPYSYGEVVLSGYLPIYGPLLGALSGSYGQFFAASIEDDARIFYQGGSRSVRGYRFRSIYPSYSTVEDGDTVIYTGLTPRYFRVNQELRFNIPINSLKNWQLVQFWDWAFVTDAETNTYEGAENASLGFGIRYKWQFLTLRLDYAFKKEFGDWGPEAYRFSRMNFDLSQAF